MDNFFLMSDTFMEHIDYNLLYHTNPNDLNGLFRKI